MKRGAACLCGLQHAAVSSRAAQALQQQKHIFWTCTRASAIRWVIQHNLQVSVQLLPQHMWLIERPYQTVRKEVWYVVCLAALTAMFRARGMMCFILLSWISLNPHRKLHGSVQSPNGARKILVSTRCLQACSGQCQPQKLASQGETTFASQGVTRP